MQAIWLRGCGSGSLAQDARHLQLFDEADSVTMVAQPQLPAARKAVLRAFVLPAGHGHVAIDQREAGQLNNLCATCRQGQV